MSSHISSTYKNPSRKSCEQIIKKILTREFEEYGENHHFKQASDFMVYFESLHPASASLTKQVQRAVNSLNLARDENGYFMIHKTAEEYQAGQELAHLLQTCSLKNLEKCTPFLLETELWKQESIIHIMHKVPELQNLYETILKTNNGILIYTKTPDKLSECLSDFMNVDLQDTD